MTATLFAHDASREGKVVTRLYGFEGGDPRRCTVVAEVYSATVEDSVPKWLVLDFPTRNHARRFAHEALVALEYLDCIVTDVDVGDPDEVERIANAVGQAVGGSGHAPVPALAS